MSGEDSDPGSAGDADVDADADADADADGDTGSRNLCVDIINEYRATEGKPPYARWADAEPCSDDEARSDSETGIPHGAFGACGESAQNECPGWPGPVETLLEGCLAGMWAEGPGEPFSEHGHYINMSSTSYTEVACGFHTTAGGGIWALQNFR